jgi:hypothetical protein
VDTAMIRCPTSCQKPRSGGGPGVTAFGAKNGP